MRRILPLNPFISKIKLDCRNLSNWKNMKKKMKKKISFYIKPDANIFFEYLST